MHSVVTVDEQNGGGPVRAESRSRTGHDSPGRTSRPVVAVRFSVMLRPGLPAKTPVKSPIALRLYATAYPPRIVAWSGSPSSVRRSPFCTLGRHAAPTLGATLFQSVL